MDSARRVIRTNDYAFKWLLGSPERKGLLLSFINSVLSDGGDDDPIADVTLLDREQDPENSEGKLCQLDLLAKAADGREINIEVQTTNDGDIDRRSLNYWARRYGVQVKRGEPYTVARPVIMINLLTFVFFKNGGSEYHSCFELLERRRFELLNGDLQMHFIELPKWTALSRKTKNRLERWLAFFANKNPLEVEEIAMIDTDIAQALEAEKIFTADERAWLEYERRERDLRDYEASLAAWKNKGIDIGVEKGIGIGMEKGITIGVKKGREEGIGIGREEGIGIGREEGIGIGREEGIGIGMEKAALNMLELRLPVDIIRNATGLSEERIRSLRAPLS